MLFFLLLITLAGRAQQTLVDAKKISARDSIRLGGVWRSTWPTGVAGNAWQLVGDGSTNPATNFIGTTNAVDFVTRTNNVERLRVSSGGANSQLFKITGTGITSGIVANIDAPGVTTGVGLLVNANALTTGGVIAQFATSSTGNFPSGAFKVLGASNHTGDLMDVLSGTLTGRTLFVSGNALTTGSGLEVQSSSNILNSINGVLYVNNAGTSTNGILARFRANSTAGSGLTIKANGLCGFGTSNPNYQVDIVGGFKLADGTQGAGKFLKSDASGVAQWADSRTLIVGLPNERIGYGNGFDEMTSSNNLTFNGYMLKVQSTLDGVYLSEDIIGGESGLYSANSDQQIATFNSGDNLYNYANGYINTNGSYAACIGCGGDSYIDINGSDPVITLGGPIRFANYAAGTATFDASGNISSFSDERLKTKIKPYKTGLSELLKINPIQYSWNKKSKLDTLSTYAGFSAQNVRDNIPFGTGENKDGYLSLQDRAIMATVVNAIKEQQKIIDDLRAEIEKLKKQK